MGGAEPTACKNNPIFRAEHTPLIPPKSGQKHSHVNTVVHKLFPNITNYFSVPIALRGRCMRRLLCVLDMSTRHSTGVTGRYRCHWLIQLLHKPLLQHRHSASVCGVWRGHLNTIHVRNVMGVQLSGSLVVLRTNLRLDSPGQLGEADQSLIGASPGVALLSSCPGSSSFMGTHVQISLSACPSLEPFFVIL